ncbi:MOSC N-terminal beta barrel domain-containing protein [Micromonospora marina]|uniref:MOSC N-terminal beta barrel domain-containing protein n=1 Tax=Micromonospora marina TaxID=307120 RepID=A0A1C4VYQ9_9ACTN|nr:MOSC N-terminal beta barrel domain-containing protein [Micromonospora marina]
MRLVSAHLYPVKSLGGVGVDRADVQPWGLRHDRRWLVLRPDGGKLTSSALPALLGLTAAPGAGSITLAARDGSSLTVVEPADGPPVPTDVSRLGTVRLAADEAHDWLSARLGRPVRLAWLDDPHRRPMSAEHGGGPGDPLNLSDAGPLLVATVPSLRRLRDWIVEGALEAASPRRSRWRWPGSGRLWCWTDRPNRSPRTAGAGYASAPSTSGCPNAATAVR